jgi:hypothetical protein
MSSFLSIAVLARESRVDTVIGTGQSVLGFETFACVHQPVLAIPRVNVAKTARVDCVDRDVNMQVFRVDMHC